MAYVGGDLTEVTYNHPTAGQGTVYCKAAEDGTFDLGGFMNNDDENGISGNGELVVVKNRKRWSVELPPILWDMTDRNELGKMQDIADSSVEADWTISSVNGSVYAGKGTIVGSLNATSNDPQITLKLAGSGRLEKQN